MRPTVVTNLHVLFIAVICVAQTGCDEDFLSSDPPAQIAAVDGKKWQLQSLTLKGKKLNLGQAAPPTLVFDGDRFSGSGGCNSYHVRFVASKKGAISVTETGWTAMACADPAAMQMDRDLGAVFASIIGYSITPKKLTLFNKTSKTEAVFVPVKEPAPSPLTGVNWRLKTIQEFNGAGRDGTVSASSIVDGTSITLRLENGTAEGSAGCNTFKADAAVAGPGVSFTRLEITSQKCDPAVMQQETKFFESLKRITRFTIRGKQLSLLDKDENALLTFRAAP